jgi:hypothetical protein
MNRTGLILVIAAIVIFAVAGYLLFGTTETSGVTSVGPATEAELIFLALTNRIDPVTFDASIVSDPRFMSLQDIRTAIVAETSGRTDPFAPLGR